MLIFCKRVWNLYLVSLSSRFLRQQKRQDKNLNVLKTKGAFSIKQNLFFIIFKGFSLSQIKTTFLEGEIPTLNNQGNKGKNRNELLLLESWEFC